MTPIGTTTTAAPGASPVPRASGGGLNEGLGSWPARRARMTPHRTALVNRSSAVTYAELDQRVTRLANALHGSGVRPGDRVAYLGPNDPAFLETLFATARLGGIFVPLNIRLAAAELSYMLADSGASVLVWDVACSEVVAGLGDLPSLMHRVSVAAQSAESPYEQLIAAASSASLDEVAVALDDVCMIMYTSGTTGTPKGAMLTHGNLTWNCYNLLLDLDLTGSEVALASAPLFHTAGLNHTALPVFLKGGTNVLVAKYDPENSIDLIAEHSVTLMFGVPAMFQQIAQSPRWSTANLSSLRILHCGGAPVPEALIRRYQERGLTFVQGYGMTEASPGTMVLRPEDSIRKIGSAGTPHFFTSVQIVRPDLTPTDSGEVGEVVVRGPNVMRGYWGRPEDSQAALAGGWLHTGDAATMDRDGFVYIVDRLKDMYISGGENVYPAEVEKALHDHPAVRDCIVVGIPDERWGEVGRAVVVLHESADTPPEEILGWLRNRLAGYKVPRSIVVVDDLPHNASGKLMRADVKRRFGAQ